MSELLAILSAVKACNRTKDGCAGGGGIRTPHETQSIERDIEMARRQNGQSVTVSSNRPCGNWAGSPLPWTGTRKAGALA